MCLCRFNKREEDFATRAGYDNYLEEREDIAFNLIEVIDVPAATERLARYERENADSIVAVAARQVSLDELMGMPLQGLQWRAFMACPQLSLLRSSPAG